MVVKRVNAISVGKVLGALYAILGLLVGAMFSLFALVGMAAAQGQGAGQEGLIGLALGAGAIVLFPVFYGVMGFVGGIIMALIYNLVAGLVGGIELEVTHEA